MLKLVSKLNFEKKNAISKPSEMYSPSKREIINLIVVSINVCESQ